MLKYYNNITKTLSIPFIFNEELKDIPNETEIIIFSQDYKNGKYSKFNQIIKENVLPCSLHTLRLGSSFNQEIKENVLHKSIKKIDLYSHCNLINNLPLQLTEVYIKFCNYVIDNKEINNLLMILFQLLLKIKNSDEKY